MTPEFEFIKNIPLVSFNLMNKGDEIYRVNESWKPHLFIRKYRDGSLMLTPCWYKMFENPRINQWAPYDSRRLIDKLRMPWYSGIHFLAERDGAFSLFYFKNDRKHVIFQAFLENKGFFNISGYDTQTQQIMLLARLLGINDFVVKKKERPYNPRRDCKDAPNPIYLDYPVSQTNISVMVFYGDIG